MINIKNIIQGEIPTLQKESANIIDVFTKTINDLDLVNDKISNAWSARNNKIAELEKEQKALEDTKKTNNKIRDKLTSILKD